MENLRRDDILRLMAKGYVKVTPIEKLDIELTGSVNYYDSEGMSYNYTANDINWTQGKVLTHLEDILQVKIGILYCKR